MSPVFSEGLDANSGVQMCQVWCGALCGPKWFHITKQRTKYKTSFRPSSVQTVEASTTVYVKEHAIFTRCFFFIFIFFIFRNLSFPLRNKDITAFVRHTEQCLFPSPQNAFCFTNLSRLFLEILRFFEKHAQKLNTPQNYSASWELKMGFDSAFTRVNKNRWP